MLWPQKLLHFSTCKIGIGNKTYNYEEIILNLIENCKNVCDIFAGVFYNIFFVFYEKFAAEGGGLGFWIWGHLQKFYGQDLEMALEGYIMAITIWGHHPPI